MAVCSVTGSVVGYDGEEIQAGSELRVFKAISAVGSIIASDQEVYKLKNDGTWTPLLRFERGSIIYAHLNALGYDRDELNGTPLQIPNTSTAALSSIISAVDIPDQVPIAFPSSRLIITPQPVVYDLAGNILGTGLLINLGGPETVPAGKLLDLIRLSEGDGGYLVFLIGANAQVDGEADFLQSHEDSDVSSILHGVITTVSNKSAGTVKSGYFRAISESGSTGPAIAGVFAVQATPDAINWIQQLTGTDDIDYATFIHAADQVSAEFNNGIVFDKTVWMRTGGRFFGAYRKASFDGDFISYREQDETLLFSVDNFGRLDAPNVECKRSTLIMDVNATAYQDLFSVPAGKTLIATKIVLRGASADLSGLNAEFILRETESSEEATLVADLATLALADSRFYRQIVLDQPTDGYFFPTVSEGFKYRVRVTAPLGSPVTMLVDLFGYYL